jgi:hypothetical protein
MPCSKKSDLVCIRRTTKKALDAVKEVPYETYNNVILRALASLKQKQ